MYSVLGFFVVVYLLLFRFVFEMRSYVIQTDLKLSMKPRMAKLITLLPQLGLFALSYMVLGIEAWALCIITIRNYILSSLRCILK